MSKIITQGEFVELDVIPIMRAFGLFIITVATFPTHAAANLLSPAIEFAKKIKFRPQALTSFTLITHTWITKYFGSTKKNTVKEFAWA